ncbi:MAG: hypothetical protein ABIP75_11745 [Pyrinomonadaceae bacterium]
MVGLITVDELRAWFAVSPDIADARLEPGLATAARRVRAWVGDDAYADAQAESPVDEVRRDNLRAAEAHLTLHFALLGLNTVLRPGGVVKQEQVEGGVLVQYLNPADLDSLAAQYLSAAEESARPYARTDGNPPEGLRAC